MVKRLQDTVIRKPKGVLIVDLDGTLITTNSLHLLLRRLPGLLLRRGAIRASIESARQMLLRSLRLVDHRSMKWHLTKIARRHLLNSDWERLAEDIAGYVNPKVKEIIDSRRGEGCLIYIATAAPEEYSRPLCRLLGFEGVIATKFTDDIHDYVETRRDTKLEKIRHLLQTENLELDTFLTDHEDDMPTAAAYRARTIIVNPGEKTAAKFRQAGITGFIS